MLPVQAAWVIPVAAFFPQEHALESMMLALERSETLEVLARENLYAASIPVDGFLDYLRPGLVNDFVNRDVFPFHEDLEY